MVEKRTVKESFAKYINGAGLAGKKRMYCIYRRTPGYIGRTNLEKFKGLCAEHANKGE